jgi:hypothetical protein
VLFAIDLRLQFYQIGKNVGLAPQIVRDHRRMAFHCGHNGDVGAAALHSLDQWTKVAVPRKQYDLIDISSEFHRVDRELDAHVALMERNSDATILSPDDGTRIDFLLRKDYQCKLVRDADLRPDVECGPGVRQIANNTTYGDIAEPDQTSVQDAATLGLSHFRKVDDRHSGRAID